MATVDIQNIFDWEAILSKADELLEARVEVIQENIRSKTSNNGARLNYLGLPSETTGKSSASVQSFVEPIDDGWTMGIIGGEGIQRLDTGNSAEAARSEYGTFSKFYYVIKDWARTKESKYGLSSGSINAFWVAKKVWDEGGVLWRSGGGAEILTEGNDLIAEQIAAAAFDTVSAGVSELLTSYLS